ncbi:GspH/FimT family pseudopilin [Azonexus sp.]|uniref:GspH/FimT family pseudopilin n=1 Tax=Azonexus sp. TaxID=1872668 RepID=UPI00282AC2E1|nr:GspH/FimT family pseudopilin [Azonexus sp.]MDR1995507.1 GspH/FimT family pseudopilin [Azonexus sp.]
MIPFKEKKARNGRLSAAFGLLSLCSLPFHFFADTHGVQKFLNSSMRTHSCHCPVRGFTLIELIVTIAVMTILLTIAVPSFLDLVRNNRLESALGEVQYSLTYARSEAVTRRQLITVCPTTNGSTCNGAAWQDGLLIFVDPNLPNTLPAARQQPNANDILKHIQFGASGLQITGSNGLFISFLPSGNAVGNGDTLRFCDARTGSYGRQLQLFLVGRTESSRGTNC